MTKLLTSLRTEAVLRLAVLMKPYMDSVCAGRQLRTRFLLQTAVADDNLHEMLENSSCHKAGASMRKSHLCETGVHTAEDDLHSRTRMSGSRQAKKRLLIT